VIPRHAFPVSQSPLTLLAVDGGFYGKRVVADYGFYHWRIAPVVPEGKKKKDNARDDK